MLRVLSDSAGLDDWFSMCHKMCLFLYRSIWQQTNVSFSLVASQSNYLGVVSIPEDSFEIWKLLLLSTEKHFPPFEEDSRASECETCFFSCLLLNADELGLSRYLADGCTGTNTEDGASNRCKWS